MGLIDTVKTAWQAGRPEPRRKRLDVGVPSPSWTPWWTSQAAWMDQIRQVGDGASNSIVHATLRVLTDAWAEPPPAVWEIGDDGQPVEIEDHPLPDLLENPNPEMTSDLLWHYYVWATRLDGNAYLWKARNGAGRPVELWPLRPDLVTPIRLKDRGGPDTGRNIDAYAYRPGTGGEVLIDPADIVHLRLGLDPGDHALGVGPIKTVLKEVVGDEAAAKLIAGLLSNMGIPGVVLAPEDPTSPGPSESEADAIARRWRDRFSGEKAGRPLILSGRLRPVVTAFTPEQLDVSALRRVPEERIPAVCGVPSILAGMGAGLTASSGRSESVTLLEAFTERTMIPDWSRVARQLTRQLLPDVDSRPGRWVAFRLRDVRALAEDEHRLWERVDKAVRSGWITVAEAKIRVGMRPQPGDDVYLRPVSVTEVRPGDDPAADAARMLDAGSP